MNEDGFRNMGTHLDDVFYIYDPIAREILASHTVDLENTLLGGLLHEGGDAPEQKLTGSVRFRRCLRARPPIAGAGPCLMRGPWTGT